jgi:hypothetical protein
MTRLWASGVRIAVERRGGSLYCFVWEGRTYRVEAVANRWRVDVGWWRLRVWRDYYKLVTAEGLLVVVYHDLLTGRWYLQRLYD